MSKLLLLTFVYSLILVIVLAKSGPDTEPIDVNQVHSPQAQCKFAVHEKSANGPEIQGWIFAESLK